MIEFKDFTSARKCHWNENLVCENEMYCGLCKHQPNEEDKINGKAEPVHVDWQIDYGMKVPYCPSCGEMAYSSDRCVFCGQKFLEDNEPQNKQEVTGGIVDEDGTIHCEKCGSTEARMTYHADGVDFYEYCYKCDCGNTIAVRTLLGEFE